MRDLGCAKARRVNIPLCMVFCIAVLTFPVVIHPEETGVLHREHITVRFDGSLQNAAEKIADIYPHVRDELEDVLQWHLDIRPTVVMVRNRRGFHESGHSSLVVAIARPRENLIVIDSAKASTHPFSLEVTLKHELAHIYLYHITGGNLPKWLNEGVSQWLSGGMAEIIRGENKDRLKQATLSRRLLPLDRITSEFPDDQASFILAYEESKSVVEYIDRQYGEDAVLQILHHLGEGSDIRTAVHSALLVSLDDLESMWHQYLSRRFTWFDYLSSNLYTLLFFFAAVLLTYGFIRVLISKWTYRDEDEEDMSSEL